MFVMKLSKFAIIYVYIPESDIFIFIFYPLTILFVVIGVGLPFNKRRKESKWFLT